MLNFNFCIFEPPQPIPSHFMGVLASFSHSYYFLDSFRILFFIIFLLFFIYLFIIFFFCGNLKRVTADAPSLQCLRNKTSSMSCIVSL